MVAKKPDGKFLLTVGGERQSITLLVETRKRGAGLEGLLCCYWVKRLSVSGQKPG